MLEDTHVVLYPSGPVSGTFHLALLSSLGKKNLIAPDSKVQHGP